MLRFKGGRFKVYLRLYFPEIRFRIGSCSLFLQLKEMAVPGAPARAGRPSGAPLLAAPSGSEQRAPSTVPYCIRSHCSVGAMHYSLRLQALFVTLGDYLITKTKYKELLVVVALCFNRINVSCPEAAVAAPTAGLHDHLLAIP